VLYRGLTLEPRSFDDIKLGFVYIVPYLTEMSEIQRSNHRRQLC